MVGTLKLVKNRNFTDQFYMMSNKRVFKKKTPPQLSVRLPVKLLNFHRQILLVPEDDIYP